MPSRIVVHIKLRTPEVMAAAQRVCWDAAKQTASAIEQAKKLNKKEPMFKRRAVRVTTEVL
mgnify:CR=1 FL=1